MKKVICRSCRSKKSNIFGRYVYGDKNQHFYKCDDCKIIYLYPVKSKKNEKLFYENDFEEFMDER